MKYGLSDKQLIEIVGAISSYKAIEKAVIFGSRTIDTFKEASDVDIAIMGDRVSFSVASQLKSHLEEESYLPFFFDVVAYNTIKSKALKKHINDRGKTIYQKGWREVKLGEVCEFGNGKARPHQIGAVPVYGGNGILGYTSGNNYDAETVILGRVGAYCGSIYYANRPIWISDNALAAKPKNNNDTKYLYYFLKNLDLNSFAQGSSHPLITQTLLNAIDVYICKDEAEQKAIPEVLSSLDDKIDLLHRQNKTLETMAQALFRQGFVEPCKDGLPEGWEEKRLGEEFDFTMGQSPPGNSYNEAAVGVPMFQGNADFQFRFPKKRIYTTKPKRFADKFDTLISVRAPVGDQNMASDRCCIGRGVAAFRYRKDNSAYTYTYFKIMSLLAEIKEFNNTGTVFGSISKLDFTNFNIIIPPDKQILKFRDLAKPLDDKIIANQPQIQNLESLRDVLLPQLMSGKVRVGVIS